MGDMSLRRAGPTLSGPADLFFKLVINFNSSSGSTGSQNMLCDTGFKGLLQRRRREREGVGKRKGKAGRREDDVCFSLSRPGNSMRRSTNHGLPHAHALSMNKDVVWL